MTIKFGGTGTSVLATFAAGTIPPSTPDQGVFASALIYGLADTGNRPLFEFSAGGSAPDIAVRIENSNGNARVRVRDAAGQAVYAPALPVGGGAYSVPGWARVSVLLLRSPDDTEYRIVILANARKAAQNSNNDSAATTGIEAAITQLVVGMGYGASGNTDDMADMAWGYGISEALAEEIHLALFNGGAHRSMLETPYAALMYEVCTIDRVGAGESVEDTDPELQGVFGRLSLVNSAATGKPTWSTRATPYTSPPPPSFGENPEVPDDPITQMQVGDSAVLFEFLTLFYRNTDDLDFVVNIDEPARLALTSEAIANAGLTVDGPGVFSFTGPYTAIQAIFQSLPYLAIDNGDVSVEISVSDGVHTVTRTIDLTIVDRNPVTPLSTDAYDFGAVLVGAQRDWMFGLLNTDNAPQSIDIDTISVGGEDAEHFFLVENPAPVTVPFGLRAAAEDYPVGTVRFSPSAAGPFVATLTITTDDTEFEDAVNDPRIITLTGVGVQLPLLVSGCVSVTAQPPEESSDIGTPWINIEAAASDDDDCAESTVNGLSGNYSTRRISVRYDLAGRFPDDAVIQELEATIRAHYTGAAPVRLAFAQFVGIATGWASGNLVTTTALTTTEAAYPISIASLAPEQLPTGADLAMGVRFEFSFSVSPAALTDGQTTTACVDAIIGPDQICIPFAGGGRGRSRVRSRSAMIRLLMEAAQ